MDCIYCGHKTTVANSRPQKRLQQVWRRRKCTHCSAIFTTTEGVELGGSLMVRNGTRKLLPFDRDYLYLSVHSALGHRKDAVSAASALTATIIAELRKATTGAVLERSDVVRHALTVLKRFDTVAAVQYGAYHKL